MQIRHAMRYLSIRIEPFRAEHLPALVGVVRAHTELVPPRGAEMSENALLEVLTGYPTLWHHHYHDEPYTPDHVQALVALEGESVSGMVVVRWDDANSLGHIGLLAFDSAQPDAGDILVEAAVETTVDHGCKSISTDDRCPLGLGWFGVPGTWPHVVAALERSGFAPADSWVLMVAETDVPPTGVLSATPPTWQLLWTPHPAQREWRLELFHDEELAAECDVWGVPPHLAECDGFEGWISVEWIGVSEEHRRMGLARWLITRQLAFHRDAGRTHVMLWTGPDNGPARRLYHDLSFVDGPETRIYRRAL